MPSTLGDEELSVIESTLRAHIVSAPDIPSKTNLSWYLSIDASYGFEHEGVMYGEAVRAYFEALSFPQQSRDWTELKGQSIEWSSPAEVGVGDSRPCFYLWGHFVVERGIIRFLEREGCRFRVTWEGTSSGYGDFWFDIWVVFEGVEIRLGDLDDARPTDVLARHLEPDDFGQEPEIFPHGMSVLFKPKSK